MFWYIVIIVILYYLLSNKETFSSYLQPMIQSDKKIQEELIKHYRKYQKSGPIYSDWSSWGQCMGKNGATCGNGIKKRTRTCLSGNCDTSLLIQELECKLNKCTTKYDDDIKTIIKSYRDLYNYSNDYLNNRITVKMYENAVANYVAVDQPITQKYKNNKELHNDFKKTLISRVNEVFSNDTQMIVNKAFNKLFNSYSQPTTSTPRPITTPKPIITTSIPIITTPLSLFK